MTITIQSIKLLELWLMVFHRSRQVLINIYHGQQPPHTSITRISSMKKLEITMVHYNTSIMESGNSSRKGKKFLKLEEANLLLRNFIILIGDQYQNIFSIKSILNLDFLSLINIELIIPSASLLPSILLITPLLRVSLILDLYNLLNNFSKQVV